MMTAVDASELAVRTLDEADPDFRRLLETLYGPGADVDEVYEDVFKSDPDPSDVPSASSISEPKHPGWKRKAALAATVAGGAMAVRDIGQEAGFSRGVQAVKTKLGVKVPTAPKVPKIGWASSRGGKIGLASAALGGDVLVGDTLHQQAPPKQPKAASLDPVGKLVSISDMKNGLHAARHKLTPNAFKSGSGKVFVRQPPKANMTSVPPPKPKNQAQANGAAAQQLVGSFVGTKTGKGIIAVGGGKIGYDKLKEHSQRQNDMQAAYMGYGKSDTSVEWAGTFTKLDEDKHLAFGWASVVKLNGMPVVDKQNDYIDPDDLETAVYDYMIKSRKGGHMHQRDADDLPVHVSDIVESIVFTDEKIAKMGLPDTMPRGWWIGTKIHDPEVWSEVKKGNLAGFSIHGKGRRREFDMDHEMGYS